jgi:hypothetical protein
LYAGIGIVASDEVGSEWLFSLFNFGLYGILIGRIEVSELELDTEEPSSFSIPPSILLSLLLLLLFDPEFSSMLLRLCFDP